MADPHSHLTPEGVGIVTLLVTKVAPAIAGGLIRNIFPPRKPMVQRVAEMAGGVLLVLYAGEVAAGIMWAMLAWGLKKIGVENPATVVMYSDAAKLAAFLVGLLGMTCVEGAILYTRRWWKTGKLA